MTGQAELEAAQRAVGDALRAGGGALVAWSGGLDSTALLWMARAEAARLEVPLVAGHVDHGLRADSAADAAWCREEAARLGVPLEEVRLVIAPRSSTQRQARVQRYAALARMARQHGLGVVLTAHHLDDAVETALLQLQRGASARGVAALTRQRVPLPVPGAEGIVLRRPLLHTRRATLEALVSSTPPHAEGAGERGGCWREDPTNAKDDYARNALRHHVTPHLDVPGVWSSLQSLRDDADCVEAVAEALWTTARDVHDAGAHSADAHPHACVLARAPLVDVDAPRAAWVRVIQRAARVIQARGQLERAHFASLRTLLETGRPGARLCLPGMVVTLRREVVLLERSDGHGTRALDARVAHPIELDISGPGEVWWFGGVLRWSREVMGEDDGAVRDDAGCAWITREGAGGRLVLRGPEEGALVVLDATTGRARGELALCKRAQMPRDARWRAPVLCTQDGEALWLCGVRRADRLCATPGTAALRFVWSATRETAHEAYLVDGSQDARATPGRRGQVEKSADARSEG